MRTLDLTGDGVLDTVRLDASAARLDSLDLVLSLIVDGTVKHRETWGSRYELEFIDSPPALRGHADTLLRARLDSVVSSVRRQPLAAPGVTLTAEDSAILARMAPRPTHRISFAYGYETTVRLVWDESREQFVRLWSCC